MKRIRLTQTSHNIYLVVDAVDSDVDSYQAVDKELVQEIADTLERRVQRMERVAAENHREPVQPLVLGSCLGLAAMLAALEHLTVALVVARMEMELKLRLVALALVDSAMSLEIADSTDCC
jgi:predicted metal-dependent hydrolase